MGLTIGVDVGGTKVAAGVVDENGRLVVSVRAPTPSGGARAVESVIAGLVSELATGRTIEAVGIGAAALVDASRSRIAFAANIGWQDEPLGERIEELTGFATIVENDANAAAWGEFRFGAGRGWDDLALVVIGTGVGGGIIIGGSLVRGSHGAAGEIGHVSVVPDGEPCGCGRHGCLERYASGGALVRVAQRLVSERPRDAPVLLGLGNGTVEGIEGAHLAKAARLGDPVAIEVFDEVGSWLGWGLAELTEVLDPGCFVLGGGVAEAGDLLLAPTRRSYTRSLTAGGHRVPAQIRSAELGNDAGLIGAADLARLR